jgi:hypothetical protein
MQFPEAASQESGLMSGCCYTAGGVSSCRSHAPAYSRSTAPACRRSHALVCSRSHAHSAAGGMHQPAAGGMHKAAAGVMHKSAVGVMQQPAAGGMYLQQEALTSLQQEACTGLLQEPCTSLRRNHAPARAKHIRCLLKCFCGKDTAEKVTPGSLQVFRHLTATRRVSGRFESLAGNQVWESFL